ncbi:MAG TPA: class II fructose-bisphosphatase [Thermomicrobiales bacterium]|nr:class II fructose-bisphosphatase [Thermomicrobiales bacterium]
MNGEQTGTVGGVALDRNLALELVRVTEAAAMSAARWVGRGDKNAADQAAVEAMRHTLGGIDMDGVVVIGEGEKDEAPMLYIGEQVGNGSSPKVDIAVDPIDGTRLTSLGMSNAVSVVALAERGALYSAPPGIFYMEKLAVGPEAADAIDITRPVADNLRAVAKAKGINLSDLTVVILDRPRHEQLVREVREVGARIKFITDGDVAGALMAARPGTGVDVLLGTGGATEAVIAACALKCIGGAMQCRLWPRNEEERHQVLADGVDLAQVLQIDDLARGNNIFFSVTGITDGELVKGVKYGPNRIETHSLVMRSQTGTIRTIDAFHRHDKLQRFLHIAVD